MIFLVEFGNGCQHIITLQWVNIFGFYNVILCKNFMVESFTELFLVSNFLSREFSNLMISDFLLDEIGFSELFLDSDFVISFNNS